MHCRYNAGDRRVKVGHEINYLRLCETKCELSVHTGIIGYIAYMHYR